MVTNDDRREVARRLRVRAGKRVLNLGELLWCIGCDYGDDAAAWNRLADLIEPSCDRDTPQKVAEEMFGKMRHSTKEEADAYDAVLKSKSVEIHPVDREALLALADELDAEYAERSREMGVRELAEEGTTVSRRIREACGEVVA